MAQLAKSQTKTAKMTAAEYFAMPETVLPTELIDGVFYEMGSPTPKHQRLLGKLHLVLNRTIPNGEVFFAPADVYFDDVNVAQPDIFWIADGGKCIELETYFQGAPDLIVEIFSPGNMKHDRVTKFKLYEKFGVREYWMVHPTEQYIEVWVLDGTRFVQFGVFFAPDDAFTSPVLGQEIVLNVVFVSDPQPDTPNSQAAGSEE